MATLTRKLAYETVVRIHSIHRTMKIHRTVRFITLTHLLPSVAISCNQPPEPLPEADRMRCKCPEHRQNMK